MRLIGTLIWMLVALISGEMAAEETGPEIIRIGPESEEDYGD